MPAKMNHARSDSRKYGYVQIVTINLLVLIVLLVVLDLALFIIAPPKPLHQSDDLLGWRLAANLQLKTMQQSLSGQPYEVSYSTDADGLRVFGKNVDAPIQILVLGDSFTAGAYASNDKMWFARLVEELAKHSGRSIDDFYVRAGGAGGYGTYQNVLLSEQYAAKLKPTLFIHQFCSNDYENNHYELEADAIYWSQYLLRPYASLNNDLTRHHTGIHSQAIKLLDGRSRIFSRLAGHIQNLQYSLYGHSWGNLSADQRKRYQAESFELTRKLLKMLRQQWSEVPALMVSCRQDENGDWQELAENAGFVPVGVSSDSFIRAKPVQNPDLYNADGGHLSELGNQKWGQELAKSLLDGSDKSVYLSERK
jgi:lysophospholipase L1-like esterase